MGRYTPGRKPSAAILPGDILQFEGAYFKLVKSHGVDVGFAEHSAIYRVDASQHHGLLPGKPGNTASLVGQSRPAHVPFLGTSLQPAGEIMKTQVSQAVRFFCQFSLVGKLLICCPVAYLALGCNLSYSSDRNDGRRTEQSSRANTAAARPVILLTGFEPFGASGRRNPSWEGIAALDGRPWKEHRLVCKQMKVVWGAPLEQLQEWISEYRPVAIFSFGQGGAGAFAVESRASNRRGPGLDNNRAAAHSPTIVAGGPAEFQATIDCNRLSRSLSQRNYPVRVSTRAGRYLCEETLYSLEYLKTRNRLESVLFCHVPPLGTRIGDELVNAGYVQRFVEDALEAWYTKPTATVPARPRQPRPLP